MSVEVMPLPGVVGGKHGERRVEIEEKQVLEVE